MSTPELLERQAAGVVERRNTLAADLQTVEAKIEKEREALGAAVAGGTDTARHREKLRELGEEAEGLRRALPLLDRERESLARQATEVRLATARAAYTEATTRMQRAFSGMETTLRTFAEGPLSEARAELEEATAEQAETQDALDKLMQATGTGTAPRTYPWEKHQGLRILLQALDQFATTGAVQVGGYTRRQEAEEETERPLAFR